VATVLEWDGLVLTVGGTRFRTIADERFAEARHNGPIAGAAKATRDADASSLQADLVVWKSRHEIEQQARLIEELRPEAIVEIGIAHGGGLALLAALAPTAKVVGIELNRDPPRAFAEHLSRRGLEQRVRPYFGVDQADRTAVRAIVEREFGDRELDLVVDDASHMLAPTRASFEALFPTVRAGGCYVIEHWAWAHIDLGDSRETPLVEGPPLTILVNQVLTIVGTDNGVDRVDADRTAAHVWRGRDPLDRERWRLPEDRFTAAIDSTAAGDPAEAPALLSEASWRIALPRPDPSLHWAGTEVYGGRGLKQRQLLEHFGLQRSSQLLEIGCGIGRLAYELASFFDEDGRYTGFDIAPEPIAWLNEHYAPQLPGFRFDLVEVRNRSFKVTDGAAASEFRFPYPDAAFDMVCAFEVFMHLPLEGVRNYIDEIVRVLRPGGTAVLTFMAIWEHEVEPVHGGRPFVAVGDGVHTRFPDEEGVGMGYGVELIRKLFHDVGLEPVTEIEGTWHSPSSLPPPGLAHACDLFAVRRPQP
jgi:SAM-dependent methyltransferase